MKKITDISAEEFKGKVIIVRVDYNVPVFDGKVLDDARIRASFQTIQFLRQHGASVILISHIENKQDPSLRPIATHLQELFKTGKIDFEVVFHADLQTALSQPKSSYSQGGVHLFENLRSDEGEKNNDPAFAKRLADLADMYINEAFPVCHREHASVVALPGLFPQAHMAGFTLINEIAHIEKGLHPTRPFLFLLGGAKFETKLPLIEKFLARADKVVIGGALFNDVLKAKGYEVGKSLVSGGGVDISHVIEHPTLLIPNDVQVIDTTDKQGIRQSKQIDAIGHEDMIVDIGTSLVDSLKTYISDCKAEGKNIFVLWNGPMGLYEKGYTDCTKGLAELFISEGVEGLVGGGDTSAAIADVAGVSASDSHMYVSTGGGAMIEYLMNETLPGIEALK
ncbi:MAG: hypothetical protein RIQ72_330 [Candidatus Parcubacteria bacterium]|jgi:phosphoglycerate kinase